MTLMREILKAAIAEPGDVCIEFPGKARDRYGYGQVRFQGKLQKAHRVSFFMTHGVWPQECRHTCDNPICVNPNHLLDGTHADNMRDAAERNRITGRCSKITHCPQGHPYEGDNLMIHGGKRRCRICCTLQQRKYRLKKRSGQK